LENPTALLFSLPFPSDSSRRTLALLIRGAPLIAAHALGSAAVCTPSAARCSRAGPVAAQPADGRVLAWELLRPSLPHAGGLRRQATRREARAHGRHSVRRPGPHATRWPGGTSAASSACAACQRAPQCLCAGSAAVWWPLCAPLGARVWATAACAHARAVATLLMRRPRSSAAMASCGPLAGVPSEPVARHAVEGLHWVSLSARRRPRAVQLTLVSH